ncbi:MAG TPA: putative sulfate/molybdate transporter, partial [Candidatus Sulfotelmatobacter sp.]|nr:putative sulfate/molybdate transporter [Candidatus Sulfotelmatobacter sp.]
AARSYFGERGTRVTPGRLALSMGAANLIASPLGGMPMCHGAGGMTAHARMGARTGWATGVYGLVLIAIGLVAGRSAASVLSVLPPAILGGMLLYVGIEHAALIGELHVQRDFVIAGAVAAIAVAVNDITAGVVVGMLMLAAGTLARRRSGADEIGTSSDLGMAAHA